MIINKQSAWFHIFDVILNVVIIVAIVAVIRTFLVSPFQVEGNSMLDTLEDKEYIIINKLAYHIGIPQRGDVVVFRPPNSPKKHYVKRVIGVPGDIVIIKNGKVFLNIGGVGEEAELKEDYLNEENSGSTFNQALTGIEDEAVYEIPEGSYFLLGDNRMHSHDSRRFSPHFILENDIDGKVWFIALPIRRIQSLGPPDYGI